MQLTAKRLQHIPRAPGAYTFMKRGIPIYVGKAADLHARLSAYRTDTALPHLLSPSHREGEKDGVGRQRNWERPWIPRMVREATGLRIERTNSELEALLLEANYIKTFYPKYNIANRDQKSFLSILVTNDEFPQVLATRSYARAGTYFGPFTSAHAVRETLRALRKIFPFRCSRKPYPPIERGAAGSGACRAGCEAREAGMVVRRTSDRATERLERVRHAGADERPCAGKPPTSAAPRPCLYFHLGQCAGTCAGVITAEEYRRRVIRPLLRIFAGHAKSARRLLDPEHQKLLNHVLEHTRVLSVTEKYAADLHDLQRVLHLPQLPRRIEGYDISNIHGLEAVGSMVVAIDGEPALSEYKRFKIKTLEGRSNDVGMLREVLRRRFSHRALAGPAAADPHRAHAIARGGGPPLRVTRARTPLSKERWTDPDLLLVDGGKAQLNAALQVMRVANISLPVIALAKREEEVYLPGERHPLRLPRNSSALHLLQRIRDEAHRFALSYHRMRYRKRIFRG